MNTMNRPLICGLALTLAAPLFSQGVLYSPKKLDAKTEGGSSSCCFARYKQGHHQNIDGENKGKAAVISAINLRLDGLRTYSNFTGGGRKWTNVKVMIGEGDLSKITSNFANNFTTTPTTVYNKAWSLPTVSGRPATSPTPFGGTKGEYTVPFSTNWVYTGKGDIVHDWLYAGGTLDNNVNWTTTSSRTYYFDSFVTPRGPTSVDSGLTQNIPATRLNNSGSQRCNDSAMTFTSGAWMWVNTAAYGKYYAIEQYRERVLFYSYSWYTAPGAPVAHAFSATNNVTGVDIGTGCNRLHVVAPLIVLPTMTFPKEGQPNGYTGYRLSFIKWNNALAGAKITGQAGWTDSATNRFNLTQATEKTFPKALPGTEPPILRSAVFTSSNTSTTGSVSTSISYSPVIAYSTK